MVNKKFLLICFCTLLLFSVKGESVLASWSPSPDVRELIDEHTVKMLEQEDCCVVSGPRYILPSGIDKHKREIKPLLEIPSSELSLGGMQALLYQWDEEDIKGYYFLSENGKRCVGEALLEKVDFGFKKDIDSFLEKRNFVLTEIFLNNEVNIPPKVALRVYEKRKDGIIQRYIIGDFLAPIQDPEILEEFKVSYVLAQTFYSEQMDAAFHPILVEWLNNKLSR